MERFIKKYAENVLGILSGYDRMLFRGTLRNIAYPAGMTLFLSIARILRCKFGDFAERTTMQVIEQSLGLAERRKRPVLYLPRSGEDKEKRALGILKENPVSNGLVCVLKVVEPCRTFRVKHVESRNRFEIAVDHRKCMHLYHYFLDPVFGFMHARLQTWFPFNIQICLNGREWLARDMNRKGLRHKRLDNCFPWIENFDRAQKLADWQTRICWESELRRIAQLVNPALPQVLGSFRSSYYWSLLQSEWATDIAFKEPMLLSSLHRQLSSFAITSVSSADVIRFLGRKPDGRFRGDVVSDYKERYEGIRVKHWVDHNSVKIYDKSPNLLRVETTINQPSSFKVFRHKQGDPKGKKSWRDMRQGIADLPARARVSQQANERYLEMLSSADTTTPLGDIIQPLCKHVRWNRKFVRGLRPWSQDDIRLIQSVCRGEFSINGFRNRDLLPHLFKDIPASDEERLRRSRAVTRQIRLLRAHGLIRKIPRQSRYRLTRKGQEISPVIVAVQSLTINQIQKASA